MPVTTSSIGLLNKAQLVSSCPFDAPLVAIVNDTNQLLMVSPGKKYQLLWCVQLQQPATLISWSPDRNFKHNHDYTLRSVVKNIALGPALRLFSVETGQEMPGPESITVRWLKWMLCKDICLLSLQEAESCQIKLVIEGYHSIDILVDDLTVQDMHASDDFSKLFVLDDLGILSSYTADWNNSKMEFLCRSLRSHKTSAHKEESWKAFVGTVHKYGTGMKWAVDKLRATDPSGQMEPAFLSLALLTDAPDHDHLNRLKQSTNTRDAYKYRDQLVRCHEDMRKKFEALGLGVKESEPYSCLLDTIEKQLKDFLAWFLSLFSANSDNGKVSLSTIVEALTSKELNSLKSLSEASLKKESASILASAASMEHLKQILCTLTMQEQMQFGPSSGLIGALRSGTVVAVGLDQTKTRVHLWSSESVASKNHETLSRSKVIKTMTLTTDHAVMLVFNDGSVELLDLHSLAPKLHIDPVTVRNSTPNHIQIMLEDSGHLIVL